jgi:hypothetical protein
MIFNSWAADSDNEWLMIDFLQLFTAHQHSAGAFKKY